MSNGLASIFQELYGIDLVYRRDCWKLCGDAHCCNFSRYKAKFKLLARHGTQELPLLPGEFDFLRENGWDTQFRNYQRKTLRYEYGNGSIDFDSVVSARPGCVCDHGTRTVICRLYPLLPTFDATGAVTGTAPLGIYEEIERIEGLDTACRLRSSSTKWMRSSGYVASSRPIPCCSSTCTRIRLRKPTSPRASRQRKPRPASRHSHCSKPHCCADVSSTTRY